MLEIPKLHSKPVIIESFIIFFMLFNASVEIYLTLRNILSLKKKNELVKKISTEKEYTLMKEYNKDKLIFSIFKCILITLKEVLLIRYRINQIFFDKYFKGMYMSQVLFFLSVYDINNIIEIPLNLYNTFRIEHRHGFNKMTVGLFISDYFKSTLILNIIFFFLLNIILRVISEYSSFWMYVFLFMSIFQIMMVVIYPVYIQPLFNKFTELEEGSLKTKINKLCSKIGFKASKIFIMDNSKRSTHSNAYFVGLCKEKRIVIYDTLINQMEEEEILAVLCHEFGHWYNSHTLKLVFTALIQQLIIFWTCNQLLNNTYFTETLFYNNEPLIIKLLLYISHVINIAEIPLSLFNKLLSRKYEREADIFAVQEGYGKELSEALIKLNKENKGNLAPDSLYSAFYNSHPTLVERMELVEREMKKIK